MIDCPNGDVRDALPEYLNDRLDVARRRDVESHLASCDACREELSLLRALRVTMRRGSAVDTTAIAAAIPPYRAPARRGWATTWRVAAAVVALAAGGTSIAVLRGRTPTAQEDVSRYVQTAPTPPGNQSRTVEPAPGPGASASTPHPPAPGPERAVSTRELAMAGGSISELSDRELSALVEDLESLDAVPAAEVESAEPVSIGAPEGI
jgi:anti-sigma factor RsiW